MRLKSRLAFAVTASVIALSSCGGVQSGEPDPAATTPVSVRLSLAATTVDVGTPLHGVAFVTNNTARDIMVTRCAQRRWLTVGIATSRTSYLPVRGAVACAPSVRLVPGENRFAFSVITTYRTCARPVRRGGRFLRPTGPRCMLGGGLPVLPDGYYVTRAILDGLPKGTPAPNAVHVTLLPRSTVGLGTTVRIAYPDIPDSNIDLRGTFLTVRVAATLRKVDDPATLGAEERFFDPAAARRVHFVARHGRHFVSVEITIRNVGRAIVHGSVDAQVVLLGTDNNWYFDSTWCIETWCGGPGAGAGGAYNLAPGRAATGDVTFAVPDGVRIGLVRFGTNNGEADWGLVPAA
jgi:hypothetical protein